MAARKPGTPGVLRPLWPRISPANELCIIAALSRVVMLLFLVFSNRLFDDHEAQGVLIFNSTLARRDAALESFTKWDSAHFLTITKHGYRHEWQYAFFPVYPMLMRWAQERVSRFLPELDHDAVLVLVGVALSNVAFVVATRALFWLTLHILESEAWAYAAALAFCINPASVFMSTVYTESIHAALFFSALRGLEAGQTWTATALFTLAAGCRSNGILGGVFIAANFVRRHARALTGGEAMTAVGYGRVLALTLQLAAIATPYITMQRTAYISLCTGATDAVSSWCTAPVPHVYGHVQGHYWNVGLLRFWTFRQIPNFLLATPALLLALVFPVLAVREKFRAPGAWRPPPIPWTSPRLLVHTLHMAYLGLSSLLVFNVHVATRLLAASCPIFHWSLAWCLGEKTLRRAALAYVLMFNIVGGLLHVNFYPWT